ncbi:hypothetical protein BC938DRAFT_473749 [Jimgerdemannia flammicorona]|uniref:Rap-GAP domain-containing protein n=1 Tax=Jimgerdemannia flammicorona TaxID=994334 RepID=A0A433Q3U5_9FUNG|nr:hypothetical protein BC938DRAFT_473749 [Jimgerdemannia flammicorona]
MTISVYYARSGDATAEELLESPPSINEDFVAFLHTVGWPVDIATHPGFKGKLDAAICATAPYYADRVHEVIFNVPYTVRSPPPGNSTWATTSMPSRVFRKISSDDHVCVVWIEDLRNYEQLARRIRESAVPSARLMVYLFVNPLKNNADGLYWIRVLVPIHGTNPVAFAASQRLNESVLGFGPLVDGMIVSRHALGLMIRNTAISAHQACKVVMDTYTRPYVTSADFSVLSTVRTTQAVHRRASSSPSDTDAIVRFT